MSTFTFLVLFVSGGGARPFEWAMGYFAYMVFTYAFLALVRGVIRFVIQVLQ